MSKQPARLPTELNAQAILNQKYGATGYTVPWAMEVDAAEQCFLRSNFPLFNEPGGTATMKLELQGDGWHVWPPEGELWKPWGAFERYPYKQVVPVVAIHLPEKEEKCQ